GAVGGARRARAGGGDLQGLRRDDARADAARAVGGAAAGGVGGSGAGAATVGGGGVKAARPIALTFAGEAAATVATVWVTRQVAIAYSPLEVAGYLVLRQVLNWVLGVGLLGLNVSLPRALAADARPSVRRRRLRAALLLAAPVLLALGLIALL